MDKKLKKLECGVGASSDVFSDRPFSVFNLKGQEVSEEEFEKWKAEEGLE